MGRQRIDGDGLTLDYGLSRADVDGTTMGGELGRIGDAGTEPVGDRPVHAFFETHIEQGPILEAESQTSSVVSDAQGQRSCEGRADRDDLRAVYRRPRPRRDRA